MVRVPTAADVAAYDGAHCFRLYKALPLGWVCPACRRTVHGCLHWALRTWPPGCRYWGWLLTLHLHHDHGCGCLECLTGVKRGSCRGRFSAAVICGQCNAADGNAKRRLELPVDFSFSVSEIGRFVSSSPHSKHSIKYTVAFEIYEAVRGGSTA